MVWVLPMLLAVLASAALASGGAPPACNASDDSAALARARALVAPSAELTHGGEYEGFDFWLDHAETLAAAWRAYGPRDPRLGRGLLPLRGRDLLPIRSQPLRVLVRERGRGRRLSWQGEVSE